MSQGEPAFLDDLVALLTAQPDTFYLTRLWCDRATEEAGYQAWLADHTQPKYTDPADSAHVGDNFPDGCARAGDVTLVRDGRDVWEYTDPAWLALIAAVRAHPRLHSGADFTDAAGRPTPDQDHIEKLHWQRDKTP
jgi:hypothetical protein